MSPSKPKPKPNTATTRNPQYTITPADFTNPLVLSLLETHLSFCQDPSTSPLESIKYVLDISSLQNPNISLWTIWSSSSSPSSSNTLLGCAALKTMSPTTGELKSMHIIPVARGTKCAHELMRFLLERTEERGWEKLYLETGRGEAFGAARTFYARCGFEECGVYGAYEVQESSYYMVKHLF